MKSIRAFIAVSIREATDGSLPVLARVQRQLGEMNRAVKAVAADQQHVTLKFLGDTQPQRIADVARVLSDVILAHHAFCTRLFGVGAFPHAERPSVIWAGLDEAETLCEIASDLEARLEEFGFAREGRAFHPHLTLARIKRRPPAELFDSLDEYKTAEFGTVSIERVELIKSELSPDGPIYTRLAACDLAS